MKILVISHEYPPIGGGGANACRFLTKEFAGSGHQVTIVTAAFSDLPEEERNNNIRIIRVKALRKKEDKSSFLEMFSYLCSAWGKVDRLVKKEKFDVCQVYFGIPSGPIGLYLRKKYGIPYVIRFGGGDIPGAQKRFSFIYKILAPVIRRIWANADALVANSEELQKKALAFEDCYPVDIIPNGVDSGFFTKGRERCLREEKDTRIDILFVSRLIQGKGLQHVIPYMEKIARSCEQEVHLTIVGDGPYREELEKITREQQVSAYVSFEGKKSKQELYSYYNNADMFILPSESEGMPNVVLEAMAMGLPVIMTPCGGSKELIDGNGWIVPIEGFVDAVIALCNDKDRRIEMGKQSELITRTKFGWREQAEKYSKIFEKSVQR